MRLQAYEGQEPFVFVSYAHKDTDKVMGVLTELDRRGYRIWYDDGIVPGSEWPENIAEHLTNSAMVLAFISRNSIDSPNCRREVTFALSKRKPFLSVVLEKTEMSPGMELQLSAQQSVIRNNYEDEAGFINKICSCPGLQPCLRPVPAERYEAAEETVQIASAAKEAVKPVEKPAEESAVQPLRESVQASAQKPVQRPAQLPAKPTRREKTLSAQKKTAADGKKKKRWISIAGILIGFIVLAILISRVISCSTKTPKTAITDKTSVSKTTAYVKLTEETVTDNVVGKLKKLEKLSSLELAKCTVTDSVLHKLTELPLTTLKLTEISGITDFSFLGEFANLNDVTLDRCGVTDSNFTLASNGKITRIDLSGNTGFTDLKLLNCQLLITLDISETGVTDISALSDAKKLAYFYASDTKVADISPLAALTELKTLSMNRSGVKTVETEFQSLRLQILQLADCGITNADGFINLTVLKEADLSGNQLTDISWLYKSAATLQKVRLAGNPLTDRLQQLSECKQIQILDITGIPVYTLYCVKDTAGLTELYAENCQITSIEELADKANLKIVDLSDNKITDYSAVSQIDYSMGVIDLSNNEITALSPVTKTRILNLIGNPLSYASVPENLSAQYLYCEYNTDLKDSGLADRVSARLGVVNVPADKQVELEKTSGKIRIMTSEEVQEAVK